MQERQKSSEILEELLNEGIIPVDQNKERGSGTGEAYNIIVGTSKHANYLPSVLRFSTDFHTGQRYLEK